MCFTYMMSSNPHKTTERSNPSNLTLEPTLLSPVHSVSRRHGWQKRVRSHMHRRKVCRPSLIDSASEQSTDPPELLYWYQEWVIHSPLMGSGFERFTPAAQMGLQVQQKTRMGVRAASFLWKDYMGPALRRRLRLTISLLRKSVLFYFRCLPWTRMCKCHLWAIPELRTWDGANTSPGVRSSCHMSWPTKPPFPRTRSPTFCLLSSFFSAEREKSNPDGSKVSTLPFSRLCFV